MHLGDDDIEEFAGLWHDEFGERLSTDEARHHAAQLLTLYALLAESPHTESRDDSDSPSP